MDGKIVIVKKHTISRVERQNKGRLGEIRDVGKNECLRRTHGVDKMDTETNLQEGKAGNLERGGLGEG